MKEYKLFKMRWMVISFLFLSCSSDDVNQPGKKIDDERFEAISQYLLHKEAGIEQGVFVNVGTVLNYILYIDKRYWKQKLHVKIKHIPKDVSLQYNGRKLLEGDSFIHSFLTVTERGEEAFNSSIKLSFLATEPGNKLIIYEFLTPGGKTFVLEENIQIRQ